MSGPRAADPQNRIRGLACDGGRMRGFENIRVVGQPDRLHTLVGGNGMKRLALLLAFVVLPLASASAQGFRRAQIDRGPFPGSGDIEVTNSIPTGKAPFGVALNAEGSKLYVSEFGDFYGFGPNPGETVRVFETATLTEVGTIPVGFNPEDIAISSDGRFGYVVNSTSASLTVFRTDTDQVVDTIPVGTFGLSFLFSVAEVPGAGKLYVTSVGGDLDGSDENIWIIDIREGSPTRHQVTGRILLAGGITRLAFDETQGLAYAGLGFPNNDFTAQPDIVVIDTTTDTVVDTIDINVAGTGFHGVEDVAISIDRNTLYAPVFDYFGGTSELFVVDLVDRKVVNLIGVSDDFAQHGIAISPDGTWVLVTNYLEGTVSVVFTASETVVRTLQVGFQPNEIVFTCDGSRAFVTNQASNTVSEITFDRTPAVLRTIVKEEVADGDIDPATGQLLDQLLSALDQQSRRIQGCDPRSQAMRVEVMGSLRTLMKSLIEAWGLKIGDEIPDDSDPSAPLNGL